MSKFCGMPWLHLANDPRGGTKPCCDFSEYIKKEDGSPYYLQKDSVKDIYSSKYLKDIREQFLNGEQPKQCKACWVKEDEGIESKRQSFQSRIDILAPNFNRHIEPEYPIDYQLVLNNSCNLRCRICTSMYSSAWGKEVSKYSEDDKEYLKLNRRMFIPNKDDLIYKQPSSPGSIFMDEMELWAPYLKSIEAIGGEPLYSNAWYKLINYLIDNDYAKDIAIRIVTNGTFFDKTFIEKLISNFKYVTIGVSIDGMGDIFEFLRKNGKWSEVKKNIEGYMDIRNKKNLKNFFLSFIYSVTWINLKHFPDFYKYISSYCTNTNISLNKVTYPPHYALTGTPNIYKQELTDCLERSIKKGFMDENTVSDLKGYISTFKNQIVSEEEMEINLRSILIVDKYRDESILEIVKLLSIELYTDIKNRIENIKK